MRLPLRSIFAATAVSFAMSFTTGWLPSAFAAASTPPLPKYYVLDQPKVLSPAMTESLQRLLVEHDQLTGEQIVIAIFNELSNERAKVRAREIFTSWKVGQRGSDNGLLLAVFWKEQKSQIIAGYGLESVLPEAKESEILRSFLIPELRNAQPDRAFALTALEILRTLESPLMQSGKAQNLLWEGGFKGSWRPQKGGIFHWSVWVVLGLGFMGTAFVLLTSAEAHFSKEGWYRPRPWKALFQRREKETPFHGAGGATGVW